MLSEVFTGEHPFTDTAGLGALMAILNEEPQTPGKLDPSFPPALEKIIQRAEKRVAA